MKGRGYPGAVRAPLGFPSAAFAALLLVAALSLSSSPEPAAAPRVDASARPSRPRPARAAPVRA